MMLLAGAATSLWFWITYSSPCDVKPNLGGEMSLEVADELQGQDVLPSLYCSQQDGQYSAWGALFFTPLSGAITRLYYSIWVSATT